MKHIHIGPDSFANAAAFPWRVQRNARNRWEFHFRDNPIFEITRAIGHEKHGVVKTSEQMRHMAGKMRDHMNIGWELETHPEPPDTRLKLNNWQIGLSVFTLVFIGAIIGSIV